MQCHACGPKLKINCFTQSLFDAEDSLNKSEMKVKLFAVPRELFIFKMFSPVVSAFTFKHII